MDASLLPSIVVWTCGSNALSALFIRSSTGVNGGGVAGEVAAGSAGAVGTTTGSGAGADGLVIGAVTAGTVGSAGFGSSFLAGAGVSATHLSIS